jgi:hypothetical protein
MMTIKFSVNAKVSDVKFRFPPSNVQVLILLMFCLDVSPTQNPKHHVAKLSKKTKSHNHAQKCILCHI